MFKNLKDKLGEKQKPPATRSPAGPGPRLPQNPSTASPSEARGGTSSLVAQNDEGTLAPNKELLAGMIAEPAFLSEYTVFALDPTKRPKPQSESVNFSEHIASSTNNNESEPSSPQPSDIQSFAQKLQLRVPSMESLFRSPLKESLFRSSSKESLVRTSSRDSLNKLDFDSPGPTFDPPSDVESEAEELPGNVESLPKEQLLQRLRRMERSLGSYRGKYTELVTTYQAVQREKKKLQGILSQSQDKALRRIGELREELQMDQQAKKHLQEEFDAALEEKDQLISVLQTQVSLLKQRMQNGQISLDLPESSVQTQAQVPSPTKDTDTENALQSESPNGDGNSAKMLQALTQRVKRQENMLHRCKEAIQSHKERSAQLTHEKEALQEQLDERLQELEKMKHLQMTEKTKLITQLRDAKNMIEQLEQDKGMVIAETKRQMHETLEMKEEEIVQLRAHIKQVVMQSEVLKEQKEKSEKAAFEELEKALSTAQRAEEERKKLEADMDEKIKAVEKANEEDRVNLQQELTRVKHEVVNIMKENCKREYLETIKETAQQGCLALEEVELQKTAIQADCEKRLQAMKQEVETFRTRILELESSPARSDKNGLEELTSQLEIEKNKHNQEITSVVEKHKEELENVKLQQEQLWTKKLDALILEKQSEIEKLKRQNEEEAAKVLKEKESVFHAHIEEMNEKTLEKLDVKQTELEALSSELSDALKIRQDLEQHLSALRDDADKAKQEFEIKLEQQRTHHKEQVEIILKDHEGVERILREEITQLKVLLESKEKCQGELEVQLKEQKESLLKAETECKEVSEKLDVLCQSREASSREQASIYEQQLTDLQQILANVEAEKSQVEEQIVKTSSQMNEIKAELDSQRSQVHDLKCELDEQKAENTQKVTSLTEQYESQLRELREEVIQAKKCSADKVNELEKSKGLLNQQIDELRQRLVTKEEEINILKSDYENKLKLQETQTEKVKEKAKEMQEKLKKKLSEQEAKLKKDIENKQFELSEKEKQFNSKMQEMAHASAAGISGALSKLEVNHKEQLESLTETHRRELEEVVQSWEKKLSQQAEELQEKHEMELQEKEQEVQNLKQDLATFSAEREGSSAEIAQLKDEQAKRDGSLNKLQEQLQQQLAQVAILTQKEIDLKMQLKKLEDDFSLSLTEKLAIQEQLSEIKAIGDKEKNKVSELVDKLKTSDEQLQALENSHVKECEHYEKKLEEKNVELQQKSTEFKTFALDVAREIENFQQQTEMLLQTKTNEIIEKCSVIISSLISRVALCHNGTTKIKEALLIKASKISDLEAQLKQITETHGTLTSCLQESKEHLQEKENLVMSMKVDLERLVTEKEQLQKEGGQQQQAATESEICITQLKKELSENINVVTSMREELNEKKSEVMTLNKLVSELNQKLENNKLETEAATTLLSKQHKENRLQLLTEVQELSSKVETLNKEKASALEQVDHWMNKLSEYKKKAQIRFTQNHNTIKELQNKVELSNNQTGEKEEELNRMKEEFDKQTKHLEHFKGLVEQKQIRREKRESDLIAELKIHTARIAELEEHIARKTAENDSLVEEVKKHNEQKENEQKEFAQQLDQAQTVAVEKDKELKEMEGKVLFLEEKMQTMEIDFGKKSRELEETKITLMKSKEEELKALAAKLADRKKKNEQTIAAIKKMKERERLYRQEMEEKLANLEQKLKDKENKIILLEEKNRSVDGSSELDSEMIQKAESTKISTEQDKGHALENMQQIYKLKINALQQDLLEKEKLLQMYDEQKRGDISNLDAQTQEDQIKKHAPLLEHANNGDDIASIGEELRSKEKNLRDMESVIEDLQKQLQEKEKEGQTLQQKITSFDEDLTKQRELHRAEMEERISTYDERLQALQQQLNEKSELIQALEENTEEKTRSSLELQKLLDDLQRQQKDLQANLEESEQEKEKLRKDSEREKEKLRKELNTLQKDLRSLRKEHQQELEIMKKESLEEMEQKIKCEQEDTELKHNSTLKQLMREFNTQLAQKERELELAIKETISKAQEVEGELIESHHAEITQLNKKVLEKDNDLQRTVKKYEEILESREEEMTGKVNELQKQLEKLQEEYQQRLADEESWNSGEVTVGELQAQLAQKTTLLNDSKLKEQEFREQINTLQDRLQNYEKSMYVTTVATPYGEGNLCHSDVSLFGEPTEFEYLRKVMFEYMMGHETKTMAKVITTVLKFPADQVQKILEREDARTLSWRPF
ncbi:golgin subfamily A member 4 isoform X2 [Tiliqua scincoides]|uniref:golgin subfamily A member 4 isoform X2 n=1 Tax=Tiliqua scincoides TaxID=71010 RepID=UPI003462D8A9